MAQAHIRSATPRLPSRGDTSFQRAVAEQLGLTASADLEHQMMVVLSLVGARLPDADVRAVASRLPRRLGKALVASRRDPSPRVHSPDNLDGLRRALAEHGIDERVCRATCHALAVAVGEQGRAHLRVQPLGEIFGLGTVP